MLPWTAPSDHLWALLGLPVDRRALPLHLPELLRTAGLRGSHER